MNFNNIDEIKKEGFVGFKKIKDLYFNPSVIPDTKGVYLILKPDKKPNFLQIGTGGHFKGKNPNVSIEELKSNWVPDTIVIYIGKAGKEGSNATLRSRLKQYLKFGQGKNVGHWGGRLIWQLKDSNNLIVCWKPLPKKDPRKVEMELIQNFITTYSKRPFANLTN
jgi:hypothetical protein